MADRYSPFDLNDPVARRPELALLPAADFGAGGFGFVGAADDPFAALAGGVGAAASPFSLNDAYAGSPTLARADLTALGLFNPITQQIQAIAAAAPAGFGQGATPDGSGNRSDPYWWLPANIRRHLPGTGGSASPQSGPPVGSNRFF